MGEADQKVRGCHVCCYREACPDKVKINYGFTLVGFNSHLECEAYTIAGMYAMNGGTSSEALLQLEKNLPDLRMKLGPSDL